MDAGVNRLQTGTLTYSDIENTSSYDAKGFSLSGGYSKGTDDKKQQGETGQVQPTVNNGANWSWQNFQTGSTGTAAGIGSKSGDATSTTTSGISGGSLLITDEAGQLAKSGKTAADALAGVKRDVISGDDAGGLTKQWDGQALRDQVAAQAQITATAGQQATKFVGDYAQGKVDKAAELYAEADATGDDSKRAEADQLMKDWGNGGTLRVLSHAVVGGLTGGTEGALGAAAGIVAAPYLAEALEKAGINKAVAATLTGLSASALGAAAGGAAGGAAALNEVSNNYLGHQERMEYATALIACSKSGTQCERAEQLKALSEERNLTLRGACSDPASGGCAEQKQLAAAAMQDQLDHAGEYTAWLAGHVPELVGLFNSDKEGSLTKDFVTHVTTADLGHKLACAMAGDCSNQALASAAWSGSIPLSVATADSALRAALGTGAGTVGATGRVWEMVTGVAELAKGMSPAGQVGKSIDQLAYLWGNGYAATAEKNFNDAKGALNAIKTGISGYAEDLAFAAYTNTHGSWDIYDIAKAGAVGGKVSVDVLSLVVPELYAGKSGVAAKGATGLGNAFKADDVIDYLNSTRPNPNSLIRDEAGSAANSEVVNYFWVEGGGTGTATSKNRITANSDGSISINPGCSGQLCVSVGTADHAVYYLSNKRPDGSVIVFEVDASLHGEIMNSAIPQRPIPGIPRDPKAPKIVDPNKPGTALELPKVWESLLENGSRNARVYTHDEFLKEFGK
ncbi:hypothetical protein GGR59_003305 [Xanthomonas arboricola]|uniref:DUF6862 domain-containing protein n=1 Tax=Xanthomonas arboricola TaxID=56448 RepID=UPI0016227D95|nr:hypothetical protein [Xanthomonas arboricola]MBB4607024.1 hypothetical protein [Xanthomonas arboricola]